MLNKFGKRSQPSASVDPTLGMPRWQELEAASPSTVRAERMNVGMFTCLPEVLSCFLYSHPIWDAVGMVVSVAHRGLSRPTSTN